MGTAENDLPATIFVRDLMWVANSPSLLDVSGGMTSMGNHNELFSVASDQPSLNQSEIDAAIEVYGRILEIDPEKETEYEEWR